MRQLLLAALLCACWQLPGAEAETLSLQQALVLGIEHNLDLRIARLEVERSEAGILAEQGRFDLMAELGLGVSRNETPTAGAALAGNTLDAASERLEAALSSKLTSGLQARLSLRGERSDADPLADQLDPAYRTYLLLNISQPLLKDLGPEINSTDLRIARLRQQQVALGYLGRARQLAGEIEQGYLAQVQAAQDVASAGQAEALAAELLAANERRLAAGLIPVSEVNEARSAVAAREEGRLQAEQQLRLTRNHLRDLIEHGEAALPLDWQVASPEPEQGAAEELTKALKIGLQQSPELQQAKLEIEARKLSLVYAKNQLLPRLDLEASLGVNGLAGDAGNATSLYQGRWQNSVSRALDGDGNSWYAGLRFSMPLQNRVAEANFRDLAARDKQSLYRLQRAEIAVATAIRSAHDSLELGRQRLATARRSAELAESSLQQENRRLQEGLSDTFRVLRFQEALLTARLREVSARTDYLRAQAALALAMGVNLERYHIFAALPHEGVAQ